MGGHVFITQGDLTRIACDAWLLPTDINLSVTHPWHRALGDAVDEAASKLRRAKPSGWASEVLSAPLNPSAAEGDRKNADEPWMTCIGMVGPDLAAHVEATDAFIRLAASVHKRKPARGRQKALLALPLVGTGKGGASDYKGEATLELITQLHRLAAVEDVDIVLVTSTPAAFAGAQAARKSLQDRGGVSSWTELGDLLVRSQDLGKGAAAGNLVLFLGAGIGVGAGLPLWDELLGDLAKTANLDVTGLRQFDVLDQASLIETRLTRNELHAEIARLMDEARYGLGHTLLACLPINEVVTTNYDNLFEDASRAAGRPLTVLPYEPSADTRRWILKLHGSLGKDDMVLTRDDYLRIPDNRGALAGIVQALLITRRMLFVGYSLRDQDFHQIAHEVRKAVRGAGETDGVRKFGTALTFSGDGLLQLLWPDLDCVAFGEEEADAASAGRLVEIFLDAVLAAAAINPGYLLDKSFEGLLTKEDLALRDQLIELRSAAGKVPDSPAARRVLAFLRSLRGDDV
jgi:hypothetical protein